MNSSQQPTALDDATWEFMRRVSLLTRDDSLRVIWAYCQHLQLGSAIPAAIEVMPAFLELNPKQQQISEWELETVAREVLIHGREKGLSRRTQKWFRFSRQFGGLAKVDLGFGYAANFSSSACIA